MGTSAAALGLLFCCIGCVHSSTCIKTPAHDVTNFTATETLTTIHDAFPVTVTQHFVLGSVHTSEYYRNLSMYIIALSAFTVPSLFNCTVTSVSFNSSDACFVCASTESTFVPVNYVLFSWIRPLVSSLSVLFVGLFATLSASRATPTTPSK